MRQEFLNSELRRVRENCESYRQERDQARWELAQLRTDAERFRALVVGNFYQSGGSGGVFWSCRDGWASVRHNTLTELADALRKESDCG